MEVQGCRQVFCKVHSIDCPKAFEIPDMNHKYYIVGQDNELKKKKEKMIKANNEHL